MLDKTSSTHVAALLLELLDPAYRPQCRVPGLLRLYSLSNVLVDLTLQMKLEFIADLSVGPLLAKQRAPTDAQFVKQAHAELAPLGGFQHQVDSARQAVPLRLLLPQGLNSVSRQRVKLGAPVVF